MEDPTFSTPSLVKNIDMKLFLSTLCLVFSICANACIQFYVLDERGHQHFVEGKGLGYIYVERDIAKKLDARYRYLLDAEEGEKFSALNDYAAMLIKAGCSEDAVPFLKKMLEKRPDEYKVHANLAVAYELLGELDKALVHLNRSLQLNPASHENSEWFHKQILEYAIAQKGHRNDFSADPVLKFPHESADSIAFSIDYQLQERIPLSAAPNELLSKTIEESADFIRQGFSLELAQKFYAISIAYASDEQRKARLMQQAAVYMEKLFEMHKQKKVELQFFTKKKWRKEFQDIIDEWSAYQPYRYEGPLHKVAY